MRNSCFVILVLVGLVMVAGCSKEDAKPPAKPCATQPSAATPAEATEVPREIISKMEELFRPPKENLPPVWLAQLFEERMPMVLEMGAEAEQKYPNAENLYLVRMWMLQAADNLLMQRRDAESEQLLVDIANRIRLFRAPIEVKVQADFYITRLRLRPVGDKPAPENPEEIVRNFVNKYEGTPAESSALVSGMLLALAGDQGHVADEYLATLGSKYRDDPGVRDFLIHVGKDPYAGEPFTAELTCLDGEKLTLPDDLLGKVVVIDFWATWCPPCRAAMPMMKQLYEKYKPAGLEIVGISLDVNRPDLERVIQSEQLNWIHTHSADVEKDETADRYGVTAIPSVWIVGRDGKIISSAAHRDLEGFIVRALAPAIVTTQPTE